MKQNEVAGYLKVITVGVTILFASVLAVLLPMMVWDVLEETGMLYWGILIFFWISGIPAFGCLWKFWGICVRIGQDRSFTDENARAMRAMSHFMLADAVLFAGFLLVDVIAKWYWQSFWMLILAVLSIGVSICLSIVCAALSHLIYKASQLQEDQDLTI